MHIFLHNWTNWIWSAGILVGAVVLALVVRAVFLAILGHFIKPKSALGASLLRHGRKLSLWILPLLAVVGALPAAPLPPNVLHPVRHAIGLGLIASIAWLAILISDVTAETIAARYQVGMTDSLLVRKIQTQIRVLHRVVVVVIIIVALAVMLMTFPEIRQIGTSLLASAGLAGLIVGVAMRPTLSSLIAGIQIALTQPIRIGDSVVVENEWGWIEDIGSMYVVVRIWDNRRLVLPLSYFTDHPFQNWTHTSPELLGTVFLWVDYTTPVDELREELSRILKSTEKWKGDVCGLQVTDATDHAMQIRALMDARDASLAWDLRCYVREKLIQFLRERYSHCLPRLRGEFQMASQNGMGVSGTSTDASPLPGTHTPAINQPLRST
jgi:small-conductance mechanosensitive channel